MNTKICSKCCREKSVLEFYKNSKSKDGLQSYCKECFKETDKNWRESHREKCKEYNKKGYESHREKRREMARNYNYRTGKNIPLGKNPKCACYLGVYVAERILSKMFKNVERMPYGHKGYDFICNRGYKIDVKSATRMKNSHNSWHFGIKKNVVADYFLMLAFDNRDDLEPEHLWIIPGNILNDKTSTSISESTIKKWKQYELNDKLNAVISCCNTLRED